MKPIYKAWNVLDQNSSNFHDIKCEDKLIQTTVVEQKPGFRGFSGLQEHFMRCLSLKKWPRNMHMMTVGPWFSDMISRRNLWMLTTGCWCWLNIIPGCQKKQKNSEKWMKLCWSCRDLTIVTNRDWISPHFRWNVSRWKWIYIHMSMHNNILVVVYATSQITSASCICIDKTPKTRYAKINWKALRVLEDLRYDFFLGKLGGTFPRGWWKQWAMNDLLAGSADSL